MYTDRKKNSKKTELFPFKSHNKNHGSGDITFAIYMYLYV